MGASVLVREIAERENKGCDPSGVGTEARDPAVTLGYVELHIEQGPVLESEGLPCAVQDCCCAT
jgi:hypothetical protein